MGRLPQLLLFAGFFAWYFGSGALASHAAAGLTLRLSQNGARGLVEACCHLFLLVLGYVALEAMARRSAPARDLVALPRRPSAGREWTLGAALGWGLVVAALLPLILLGRLHTLISPQSANVAAAGLTLGAILVASLVQEIAFRGYPFRCLIDAIGPSLAVLVMVGGAGFRAWRDPYAPEVAIPVAMLLTLLLSLGWLRTRAVWLSWGLHFALVAGMGLLFGLPVAGNTDYGSIVQGTVFGPDWLTGGDYGPETALLSLFILIAGIVVLYRVTRDLAWQYTQPVIVPGGYEVVVAPPAAHSAMEEAAAKTPALVQILPVTPQSFSVEPADRSGRPEPPPIPTPPPPMPDRIH
jgi:membrane protease YdiL (CAAX protease family)